MKSKRLACLLMAFLLPLSAAVRLKAADGAAPPPAADEGTALLPQPEERFLTVAENGRFSLLVDVDTAEVRIRDLAAGYEWSAVPTPPQGEDIPGTARRQLSSILRVRYLDGMRNILTVGSEACVADGRFSIRTVKEDGTVVGIKIDFDFTDEGQGFSLSLILRLTSDGLTAEVPRAQIAGDGASRLCSVEVLPSFGAAWGDEEGFLFVPDGSGALIDFADRYRNAEDYDRPVYGFDPGTALDVRTVTAAEEIRMPVFGMKRDGAAFLAIVTSGDALTSVRAYSAADRYGFSAVCGSYTYREIDDTGLEGQGGMRRTVTMADNDPCSADYAARYVLLGPADASLSGMARTYRTYLTDRYGLKAIGDGSAAPLLELFGKTERKADFLGIPYRKTVRATTLSDAADIVRALQDDGVTGTTLALFGFTSGGFRADTARALQIDRALGGQAALTELIALAGAGQVCLAADLLRDYRSAGRAFTGGGFVRSMNGLTVTRRGVVLSAHTADDTQWLLRGADKIRRGADRLLSAVPDGCGILFENMGAELYNDFSENNAADRQQMLAVYGDVLDKAKALGVPTASDGANIYMLSGTDRLCEIPLTSSAHRLFSRSVPFYAMVLHGLVEMTSAPLDQTEDPAAAARLCAEFGIRPTYRVTACTADGTRDTPLSFLFGSGFAGQRGRIVENDRLIRRMQQGLFGVSIDDHEWRGALSITTYGDGTTLVHNTADAPAVYGGQTIPPHGIERFAAGGERQ